MVCYWMNHRKWRMWACNWLMMGLCRSYCLWDIRCILSFTFHTRPATIWNFIPLLNKFWSYSGLMMNASKHCLPSHILWFMHIRNICTTNLVDTIFPTRGAVLLVGQSSHSTTYILSSRGASKPLYAFRNSQKGQTVSVMNHRFRDEFDM